MKNKLFICALFTILFSVLTGCESTPSQGPVTEADLEYQRSVKDISGKSVSKDVFEMDKKAVMACIDELNAIMTDKNYSAWLKKIEPKSAEYWSNKDNLAKATERLPKQLKSVRLSTLEDYFKYVFIPSRKGRTIDEIRYISSNAIKAVQVKEDKTTVYYTFKKIGDSWLVELPELTNVE